MRQIFWRQNWAHRLNGSQPDAGHVSRIVQWSRHIPVLHYCCSYPAISIKHLVAKNGSEEHSLRRLKLISHKWTSKFFQWSTKPMSCDVQRSLQFLCTIKNRLDCSSRPTHHERLNHGKRNRKYRTLGHHCFVISPSWVRFKKFSGTSGPNQEQLCFFVAKTFGQHAQAESWQSATALICLQPIWCAAEHASFADIFYEEEPLHWD